MRILPISTRLKNRRATRTELFEHAGLLLNWRLFEIARNAGLFDYASATSASCTQGALSGELTRKRGEFGLRLLGFG
jgi:hypothetical protein